MVRDLTSSNGTFVNDQRIDAPTMLSTQDQLTIGKVIFRVNIGDSAVATPVAADHDPTQASAAASQIESAILRYTESSDGSFIGVEDKEPQASSAPQLDVGETEPRSVRSDDSSLRSFLDNLE